MARSVCALTASGSGSKQRKRRSTTRRMPCRASSKEPSRIGFMTSYPKAVCLPGKVAMVQLSVTHAGTAHLRRCIERARDRGVEIRKCVQIGIRGILVTGDVFRRERGPGRTCAVGKRCTLVRVGGLAAAGTDRRAANRAFHDPQRDVDGIVVRTPTVREPGQIATEYAQIVLRCRCRGRDA